MTTLSIRKRRNALLFSASARKPICSWCVIAIVSPNPLYGSYLQEKQRDLRKSNTGCEVKIMRDEYDFSNARKNPYAKKLKKQITINVDVDTVEYFKSQAETTGIPYRLSSTCIWPTAAPTKSSSGFHGVETGRFYSRSLAGKGRQAMPELGIACLCIFSFSPAAARRGPSRRSPSGAGL